MGETGYPRTTSKRKASRTADIPITGAAKQRPIQHRVESERNINVNNKFVQCKHVLKCYMFNGRSVINKIDDLSVFMYENDPDVEFVTETLTSSDTLDSELCMTGYELYRFDRRHRRGGGFIIYAKNDLNVVKIDIDISDTESIWCKIVAGKEEVAIGVSYNSPSSSDTCRNNLNNIVKNICSTYKNVILCGDFNYPWNLLHANTPSSQLFLDTVLYCYR